MNMRWRLACVAAGLMGLPSHGHDLITTPITFSREISRLLYARCVGCHRPGGSAFSLATYGEARPWAAAIKEEVLARRMPPWGAVKGFGEFRDEQGLSQEQIELIAEWVQGGAPEGNRAVLPKLPPSANSHPDRPTSGIPVTDGVVLKNAVTVYGIRPGKVPGRDREGASSGLGGDSVAVIARYPDGAVEPLLWLYEYDPKYARAYLYRNALRLPASTRIEITPKGSDIVLVTRRPAAQAAAR